MITRYFNFQRDRQMRYSIKLVRIMLVTICIGFGSLSAASAQSNSSTKEIVAEKSAHWGLHGMLVFGDGKSLYASHLPMFHAPHDRQVIFRFHFSDKKIDAKVKKHFAERQELWTLAPEEFDLDRLQTNAPNALKKFTGKLFQGHFERGGKQAYAMQTVLVDEVLVFNSLAPKETAKSEGIYYLIGQGTTQFLMKKIDRHPDFDVLMSVKNAGKPKRKLNQIVVSTEELTLPEKAVITTALQQQLGKSWWFGEIIYFETEDLK